MKERNSQKVGKESFFFFLLSHQGEGYLSVLLIGLSSGFLTNRGTGRLAVTHSVRVQYFEQVFHLPKTSVKSSPSLVLSLDWMSPGYENGLQVIFK